LFGGEHNLSQFSFLKNDAGDKSRPDGRVPAVSNCSPRTFHRTHRGGNAALLYLQNKMFCLSSNQEAHVLHKTLIARAAAAALGCLPMATTALAAHGHGGSGGHGGGGHVAGHGGGAHYARGGGGRYYGGGYSSGPIYDSSAGYGYSYGYGPGYGYGGCPGYGIPLVGRVINGVLGGYGPY
jgi:hypothetical protein